MSRTVRYGVMNSEKVELRPILEPDLDAVAAFLHEELNSRVPVRAWIGLLSPPWRADAPNSGFHLVQGGAVVGAYAAVYSERDVDGAARRFCNLAAFCVRQEHRAQSLRLLRAVLGQKGYEFTDLSPSGNVVALNERMGFERLDTATKVTLNLPAVGRGAVAVSEDPAVIAATLRGRDAVIHRDHRDAAAARHLVVTGADGYAYLVFRKDRRKGMPIFATPLYAGGSRALLRAAWPQVASRLLLKHGLAATLAERRTLGFAPSVGLELTAPRAKMFRSKTVDAAQVDYLYSELTLLDW